MKKPGKKRPIGGENVFYKKFDTLSGCSPSIRGNRCYRWDEYVGVHKIGLEMRLMLAYN
jgi:hypothetical protein